MTQQDLINLINIFVDSQAPKPYNYSHPTIDEQIESSPYDMLQHFANWLQDTEKESAPSAPTSLKEGKKS